MPNNQPLRYSLRQLEVFLAVANVQTTAAAARELSLSQSAVSASLKALESAYNTSLFDRVGKRLVLNPLGSQLQPRAEALLAHARAVEGALLGDDVVGDLTIAASYTIANHIAVDYLARWLERHPDARIDIATSNSPEVVSSVVEHRADLGMIETEILHPDIELIPWLQDELIVFCSPEHPLAGKAALQVSELEGERWILRERGSAARQRFEQTFAAQLTDFKVYLEFRHNQPIQRAVEQGLGISCLSDTVLRSHFEAGSLIPLSLGPEFRMQRTLYLALRKRRYHRPAVERFIDLCRRT